MIPISQNKRQQGRPEALCRAVALFADACGWHVDVICTRCRWCADDIHCPQVKSRPKSVSRVVRTSSARHLHIVRISSAHHPHVIRTRFQPQKFFQLNSRATALVKRKTIVDFYSLFRLFYNPLNVSRCSWQKLWRGHFTNHSHQTIGSLTFTVFFSFYN